MNLNQILFERNIISDKLTQNEDSGQARKEQTMEVNTQS